MSYERCEKHKILRCIACFPQARASAVPVIMPIAAAAPSGWSPEDALDALPPTGAPAHAVTAQDGPDPQALAAIARQQEILKARGDLAGAPAIVEVDQPPEEPFIGEEEIVYPPVTQVAKEAIKRYKEEVTQNNALSPVEEAARAYTAAKNRVEQMTDEVGRLKFRIEKAEQELKNAIEDRDEKKLALQTLVMSS